MTALVALKTILNELTPQDRVALMAVDLDAIPLSSRFDTVKSETTQRALAQLAKRLPLGSTDLMAGLTTALEQFDPSTDRPRRVLFVGDGVSRANLLQEREFGDLIGRYVDLKVAVISLAIGPKRDVLLLSAIANHTRRPCVRGFQSDLAPAGRQRFSDGHSPTGRLAGKDSIVQRLFGSVPRR